MSLLQDKDNDKLAKLGGTAGVAKALVTDLHTGLNETTDKSGVEAHRTGQLHSLCGQTAQVVTYCVITELSTFSVCPLVCALALHMVCHNILCIIIHEYG